MPSRGGLCYSLLGFHSVGEYGRSLVRTPQRLATRFFMRRSFADQQYDKGREGDMKVVLVSVLRLHACIRSMCLVAVVAGAGGSCGGWACDSSRPMPDNSISHVAHIPCATPDMYPCVCTMQGPLDLVCLGVGLMLVRPCHLQLLANTSNRQQHGTQHTPASLVDLHPMGVSVQPLGQGVWSAS